MQASETTLCNLLAGPKQFQIPMFQRPYSWKEENWEILWEDLISHYKYGKILVDSYFLGPIVTQQISGTAEGISPFILIDGQQRLTTLTILLAVIRNYLQTFNNSIAENIAEEIEELYLLNKSKKNDDIYKILSTQDDREVYKSIIQNKDITNKKGQIYEAYKFFDGKLNQLIREEMPPLPPILIKKYDLELKYKCYIIFYLSLQRLILVNITTDDKDNPYLIFESLNNKGEELTQVDLVRNYIFMELPSEEREKVYTNEWAPLQERFRNNSEKKEYAEELTQAFWFYLRKDGKQVREKEVYKIIKNRFDRSKLGVKNELADLIQFTEYYLRFNFPEVEEPESKLKRRFQRLKKLDFNICQIFLLNIYHEYQNEYLSLQDFEKILLYLESYFVRRWVVDRSTKILSTIFNTLYKQVKEKKPNDLVNGLHELLTSFGDNNKDRGIWPDDKSFREGIITQPLYNKDTQRTRFLLNTIEASLTINKEWVDCENNNSITIEHIMPQNLKDKREWYSMLGENHKNVHDMWCHTLGNLTLTGCNSELSNKPFNDKLNILRSSNLSLNRYFDNVDIWNEEAIKKRAEFLADKAIELWPR